MVSNFLDTLPPEKKHHIKDRTAILVEMVEDWARRYPKLRPVVPMIALTSAVSMPQVSISDAFAWARAVSWIFLVDYKADRQTFTHQDMRHKAAQWYAMATDWPACAVDDDDELTSVLAHIMDDMSQSNLFDPLRSYWAVRLRDHVLGVAQEFQNALAYTERGPGTLPSLDDYVRVGTQSVGYPFLGSMAMIFHRDASVMQHLEPLSDLLECAGAALRLYNDIATLDKEIQDGEVNSILVVHHAMLAEEGAQEAAENTMLEAKHRVLALADSYAQECCGLLERLETDSGQFEVMTHQLVALHAYFYGHTEQDYHTTPLAGVYQMFNDG